MTTIDKDALKAIVRELCGETRAEIMAEAEKMIAGIEAKFGSAAAARAQGVNTNFLQTQNIDGLGGVKAAPTFMAGRFLKSLACFRGDAVKAKAAADKAGDKALSTMLEKAMAYSDFTSGGAL